MLFSSTDEHFPMEPERPRKMELLHTPKNELAKMMRENSINVDEALFLFESNKVAPGDIRTNSPSLCDKLLGVLLKHWFSKPEETIIQPQHQLAA